MNKVTKFRAWDTYLKRMRYEEDYVIVPDTGKPHWIHDNKLLQGEAKQLILIQFTGLYDCERKEVWEGDILEYKEYYANIKWWSSVEEIPIIAERTEQQRQNFRIERREVRFNQGAFCLGYTPLEKFCRNNILMDKLEKGTGFTSDYEKKQWDFKIIGNIYEHPNLLNEKIKD